MKDIKQQCTTLEQSKKLMELGFGESNASLKWVLHSKICKILDDVISSNDSKEYQTIPCWTTFDMMEIIKNCDAVWFVEPESYHNVDVVIDSNRFVSLVDNENEYSDNIEFCKRDNLRDNLFDCIVWLEENEYL